MNRADAELSATRARRAIAAGTLAPAELVAACRAAIAARDGEIGAFARLAALPATFAAGGVLTGIPVAVKDIVDTAGLGTEYGSAVYEGHVPLADADCVRRLKAAGAAVLGKTVTTEFAHVAPKATRNPRDLQRTPGGSSSGSAAAVAAGFAPVAIGTQTGGSVIRPAAFCGVFGFKSSIGRTDMAGVHELARAFDTLGWFARCAADLSLLGTVLLKDHAPAPRPARLRIAVVATPYDGEAEPCAHAAVEAAARRLADVADIERVALDASYGTLNALHRRIVSVEASRAFKRYMDETPEKLSPQLRDFVELGRGNELRYAQARRDMAAACAKFDADIAGFDAFLLPAALGEAPVGLGSTGDATFSLFLSLLGPPCATLPTATGPGGAPVGIQFVAPRGKDEALLALVAVAAAALGLPVD
jgi:Asp-tRNA(Asn)/Glu-tRNA(Gln) amidotransferase A subunit family amidase